jgi:hypothetical protein
MRSNFYLIGAILFICRPCFAQAPTSEVQVSPTTSTNSAMKSEDSTPVILRTKQDLSSSTAKVGDRFPFRVVTDVRVADLIVIPRGADAWGLVTAVQPKRRKGRPGNLDIAIQSVQLLTGENAPLRAEQHSEGKSRDVGKMADIPGVAIETLGVGIPLIFFSMFEKGKDAYLPAGTKFTAYLNGDVALDRIALERIQPAPVQRKGPATVTIYSAENMMWVGYPVYCGKVALAKLPRSAYLKIQLPQGKYFFRSSDEQAVEVRLEQGQELYLQMMQENGGKGGRRGVLVQVDNEDGEEGIAHLRRLADKDVTKRLRCKSGGVECAPRSKVGEPRFCHREEPDGGIALSSL